MNTLKTRQERLQVVQETKTNCTKQGLQADLGTRVLYAILDDYLEKGTPYLNKELRIIGNSTPALRASAPCKFVVNLYNDPGRRDTIVLRPQEEIKDQDKQ
jgi:hypothetical protein